MIALISDVRVGEARRGDD